LRHAERVIAMDEKPGPGAAAAQGHVHVERRRGDPRGRGGRAVSAGNTGALMAISKLILRMSADLDRPALVASIPHSKGVTTFLDAGANVDCDAARLVEFAIMGEAYHRAAFGVARPTVGLLNVGSEEMKGHEEVREAHRILREGQIDLDYRGFVEGDDITGGAVNVVVTDGFTGNVSLKAIEGAAKVHVRRAAARRLSNGAITKLGALWPRLAAEVRRADEPAAGRAAAGPERPGAEVSRRRRRPRLRQGRESRGRSGAKRVCLRDRTEYEASSRRAGVTGAASADGAA
jgi:glycerol-3-phosphate acyltransferase PlsX